MASKLLPNGLNWKTENCSPSVDTHYQNAALTVSRTPSPIMADNTFILNISKQIASQLSWLQLQKLWTLC